MSEFSFRCYTGEASVPKGVELSRSQEEPITLTQDRKQIWSLEGDPKKGVFLYQSGPNALKIVSVGGADVYGGKEIPILEFPKERVIDADVFGLALKTGLKVIVPGIGLDNEFGVVLTFETPRPDGFPYRYGGEYQGYNFYIQHDNKVVKRFMLDVIAPK